MTSEQFVPLPRTLGAATRFLAALAIFVCGESLSAAAANGGFVYIATNQTTGNQIIQYSRASDGSLTEVNEVSTGGLGGTGNGVGALDPLGSQDSLVLSGSGSLLLVVNAGSDSVSSMAVGGSGLHLLSNVSSAGSFPTSVAMNGNLVYVLNTHGTPNIAGFRLNHQGVLAAIPGSVTPLPGGSGAAPHDIRFSPDGSRLVVTEGGTNMIDIFDLSGAGLVTHASSQPSAGSGPFGFRFLRRNTLVNSEANSDAVSSYSLTSQDTLNVISPSVPDTQSASCWITVTADSKFAFVSNTGSGTLSAYSIGGNGVVTLENAVAGSLSGGAPIDSALTSDGAFLYVLDSALGRIVFFGVSRASLSLSGSVTGLPLTLQGIAAQ